MGWLVFPTEVIQNGSCCVWPSVALEKEPVMNILFRLFAIEIGSSIHFDVMAGLDVAVALMLKSVCYCYG